MQEEKKSLDTPKLASNGSLDLLNLPHAEKSQSDNCLLLFGQEIKDSSVYKGNNNYQLAILFLQHGHIFIEQKGNQRELTTQSVYFADPCEDFQLDFVEESE